MDQQLQPGAVVRFKTPADADGIDREVVGLN